MKRLVGALLVFVVMNVALVLVATSPLRNEIAKSFLSGYHAHFIAFFMVSFVMSLILIHEFMALKHPFIISFVYSVIFAWLIENLQAELAFRVYSNMDILWGAFGAATYCVLGFVAHKLGLFEKYWHNL